MHPMKSLLLSPWILLLSVVGTLQTAHAQTVLDVDVTLSASTVVVGEDLVVTVPGGVGQSAFLFFAPTASLNLTTEIYASELGAQLALFQGITTAPPTIQPDLTATWTISPVPFPVDFTVFVAGFVPPFIIASNLADLTVLPNNCSGTPGHFQEENGLVVCEIESVPAVGQWTEDNSAPGFTGTSYYRWDGPNLFGSPGTAILQYPIEIYNEGIYRVKIHNYHDNPDSSLENDCWLRVDGMGWFKFFSNAGQVANWNWAGGLQIGEDNVQADYFFSPGTHLIEISARSFGYNIDRMHVYRPGVVPSPLSLSYPESCRP